jgi:hypothetical protein
MWFPILTWSRTLRLPIRPGRIPLLLLRDLEPAFCKTPEYMEVFMEVLISSPDQILGPCHLLFERGDIIFFPVELVGG